MSRVLFVFFSITLAFSPPRSATKYVHRTRYVYASATDCVRFSDKDAEGSDNAPPHHVTAKPTGNRFDAFAQGSRLRAYFRSTHVRIPQLVEPTTSTSSLSKKVCGRRHNPLNQLEGRILPSACLQARLCTCRSSTEGLRRSRHLNAAGTYMLFREKPALHRNICQRMRDSNPQSSSAANVPRQSPVFPTKLLSHYDFSRHLSDVPDTL